MKILYTTPVLEYPAAGGPQLRTENSIKALARVCELHIIHRAPFDSPAVRRTDSYFSQFGVRYHTVYKYPRSKILRQLLRVYRSSLNVLRQEEDKHTHLLLDYIRKEKIDVVWFGYGNVSYSLIRGIKTNMPSIKVVCDTDSVWSRFVMRELPFAEESRKAEILKAGNLKESEERAWVNLCEVTTAVSEVDAQHYRSIAKNPNRIKLFSNVIDINYYKDTLTEKVDLKKPCIFLAGSYGPNSAMNMAAEWVLDEVLPIVRKSYPHLHFYLVGRHSDQEFGHRAGDNVTVTGKLDSVLPYLCDANVAIVPLKFESGTRFKILEAGACRIPIVSTSLGAEGINVEHGKNILIADDYKGFAAAIIKILENPILGRRLADNCYELVSSNYSIELLVNQAQKIIEYLCND